MFCKCHQQLDISGNALWFGYPILVEENKIKTLNSKKTVKFLPFSPFIILKLINPTA